MLAYQSKFKKNRNFKRKPIKSTPERKSLPWTELQNRVFNNVENGDGHTVVLSGPGSGKTKTLVEGLYHVPKGNSVLCTAFNKSIAQELDKQVPTGITCATHHKLGFQCIQKHWRTTYDIGTYGSVDAKNDSLFELATEEVGSDIELNHLRQMLVKALDLSKITLAESPEKIESVIDHFGIPVCGLEYNEFANYVWRMMNKTKDAPRAFRNRNVITFSDMIWLPYVNGWKLDQFDRVFIDEAQDLSPARTELLLASVAPGGRICAFGDPKQAIYNFAGATHKSLEGLIKTLDAKDLPLSVSYRCARRIIALAQLINPSVQAAPDAEDGTVEHFDADYLYKAVEPGCAVLSRTNYPLVRACFGMLALGLKANIQGKDIGERLLWRIDSWGVTDLDGLVKATRKWCDETCERLEQKKIDTTSCIDEAKCIQIFAKNSANVSEVKENIKKFFSDNPEQIKLSTAHKAKGLEWDKVFILSKTYHPERGGEEENIYYVAITRAKSYLGFMEGKLP